MTRFASSGSQITVAATKMRFQPLDGYDISTIYATTK